MCKIVNAICDLNLFLYCFQYLHKSHDNNKKDKVYLFKNHINYNDFNKQEMKTLDCTGSPCTRSF